MVLWPTDLKEIVGFPGQAGAGGVGQSLAVALGSACSLGAGASAVDTPRDRHGEEISK